MEDLFFFTCSLRLPRASATYASLFRQSQTGLGCNDTPKVQESATQRSLRIFEATRAQEGCPVVARHGEQRRPGR